MNTDKKTEQLIKNFEVATTDQLDKWICDDALEAIRKAKHAKSSEARPNIWRNIMKNKITKIAAAVIIIAIALFVGINYFSSSIDVAAPAFADAIRPFLAAQTATYTCTTEGPNNLPSFSIKGMFAEPGRMRSEIAGPIETIQIVDIQKGEAVHLMPEQKTAMVMKMENMTVEKKRQAGINIFDDIRRQLQQAQDANNGDVEYLGERQIDGINTDGYRLREAHGIEIAVWVDPESLLPVRIEYDMAGMPGKQMKLVMSNFEFNVELDDSLFSLQIPEGYTVRTMQMDLSEPQEKDLIEMFRIWAETTGGKFPSALSLKAEVSIEFITALSNVLPEEVSQAFTENKEKLHQLLFEIKQDLTQLQRIIQDNDKKENLHILAENVKSHLQQLLDIKKKQAEAERRYRDQLMSRIKDRATDRFIKTQEITEKTLLINRGLAFVQKLPADSDWHYSGKAVEYGNANTPIFWYRPKGLGICRIIYGDLTIADVDFSEQPKDPEVVPAQAAEDKKHSTSTPMPRTYPLIAGEKDFIESLGMWTDFVDGRFPDSVGAIDSMTAFIDYQRDRLSKDGRRPSEQQVAQIRKDMISVMDEINEYISFKGFIFARMLDADSDWHYAGKGITVGDSEKAIFWYKPKGSSKYRVIYADLTVEQTTADQLPADSGKTQGYKDIHKEKPEQAPPPSIPKVSPLSSRLDRAKWSEGRAMMGSIATAIRAYCAGENRSPGVGKLDNAAYAEKLGFRTGDLKGAYFKPGDFEVSRCAYDPNAATNPLKFTITATHDTLHPDKYTLDQTGTWGN